MKISRPRKKTLLRSLSFPPIIVAGLLVAAWFQPAAGAGAEGDDLRRDAVVRAVEKTRPAVVNINAEEESIRTNPFFGPGDSLFDRFFSDFFESAPQRRRTSRSLGSGVIIDPEGLILTNEHVVARASRIRVTLADERTFEARIVGSDPDHDLAVLKVDSPEPLPSTAIGMSGDMMVGEKVIAIGNPFGLSHTVTTGVVSAIRRSIRTGQGRDYYDFIQTDAAINPGNSGGPLLNIAGSLIGINTAIYAEGDGIGFAIPADVARRIVEDLVRYGEVQPVWLGAAVGKALRRASSGSRADAGVTIISLIGGSPGEKAGLEVGDIIVSVGGEGVKSAGEYHFRVGSYSHGDLVPLRIRRGSKTVDFIVRAETPDDKAIGRIAWEWFGLELQAVRTGLRIKGVRRGSSAADIGLQGADYILEVGGKSVTDREEFNREILAAGQKGKALLLVQRGRWGYHVTLKVPE